VSGGIGRAVADAGDRGPDGPGDVEPGSFGFPAELARPAAETGRSGELADQEVLLGAQAAGPLGVVPLCGLGEFRIEVGAQTGLVRLVRLVLLVEEGEQLSHAAVGGDGPRLGEHRRGGGRIREAFRLPQQPCVLVQGVREHGPGTEPAVAAGGRAVVPVRCRGITIQCRQAGQVVVDGARAHDCPGGNRGAPGIGRQGLVEPRRVPVRSQDDAAPGKLS
jgi:hypothetical protein